MPTFKRTPLFLLLFCVPVLAGLLMAGGCAREANVPNGASVSEEVVPVGAAQESPLPVSEARPDFAAYTLLLRQADYKPARFEPAEGCYLGAAVLSDRAIGGRMDTFERVTGVKHAVYANEMILGGEYPVSWVLECIAAGKTPCLTVNRPNAYAPFDAELLEQTARDIGVYNVPMFVRLMPWAAAERYASGEYIAFFAEAKEVFAAFAPNAVLVWSVADGDVEASAAFYPGDANVEWVDIVLRGEDAAARLADFAAVYQRRKPIMLTTAVSHFSTAQNAYDTEAAAARLAALYEEVAYRYPRVKALVYENVNEVDDENAAGVRHDYSLTTEDMLVKAYAKAAGDSYFLAAFAAEAGAWNREVLITSQYAAYGAQGLYYLPEQSILADLGAKKMPSGRRAVSAEGTVCYEFAAVRENVPFDFYVEEARGRLVLWIEATR